MSSKLNEVGRDDSARRPHTRTASSPAELPAGIGEASDRLSPAVAGRPHAGQPFARVRRAAAPAGAR